MVHDWVDDMHTPRASSPTRRMASRTMGEGSSFNNIDVHSGGIAYLGDTYVLSQDEKQRRRDRFLHSLHFREMNMRINQISSTDSQSFQWIFDWYWNYRWSGDDSEYPTIMPDIRKRTTDRQFRGNFLKWLACDDAIFWICGKPGSGKSTLMKFIFSHPQTQRIMLRAGENSDATVTILKHCFWMAGTPMQYDMRGCLCTLLYQLVDTNHSLFDQFIDDVSKSRKTPTLQGRTDMMESKLLDKTFVEDWSVEELRHALNVLLSAMPGTVCIFLDGLDEYDKNGNIRDVLVLVEGLSKLPRVKLCISSRPEPMLEKLVTGHPSLRLQDLTRKDLENLARKKLEIELGEAGNMKLQRSDLESLVTQIAERAEGVFLWAILVIKSLSLGFWSFENAEQIQKRLDRMPRQMAALYGEMLARLQDDSELYAEDVALLFALLPYQPIRLLSVTLIENPFLGDSLKVDPLNSSHNVLAASEIRKRQISIRTAGLLEVVGWSDRPRLDAMPKLSIEGPVLAAKTAGLCTCSRDAIYVEVGPNGELCHYDAGWLSSAILCVKSEVQPIHRTVTEFVQSDAFKNMGFGKKPVDMVAVLREYIETQIAAYRIQRMMSARFEQHGVLQWLLNTLARVIAELSELEARSLLRAVYQDFNDLKHSVPGACIYGAYHWIFEGSQIYDDIIGVMFAIGQDPTMWPEQAHGPPRFSRYYRGYLTVCAARGLDTSIHFGPSQLIDRALLISRMIDSSADLFTPHLSCTDPESLRFLPRPPVVDVLLFILRLLTTDENNLTQRANESIQLLNRLSSLNGWSTHTEVTFTMYRSNYRRIVIDPIRSSSQAENSYNVDPRESRQGFFIVLQMSVKGLRDYVADFTALTASANLSKLPELSAYGCKAVDSSLAMDVNKVSLSAFNVMRLLDVSLGEQTLNGSYSLQTESSWNEFTACEAGSLGKKVLDFPNVLWRTMPCPSKRFCQGILHDNDVKHFRLLGPDAEKEVDSKSWYTCGALRDWHRQRALGLIEVGECVKTYEESNGFVPSVPQSSMSFRQSSRDEEVLVENAWLDVPD